MYNCTSSLGEYAGGQFFPTCANVAVGSVSNPTNKFVYVKQNFPYQTPAPPDPIKVHINPNFNKKVFVNPNFNGNINVPAPLPKIHINPNAQNIKLKTKLQECTTVNKILVNPNILRRIPIPPVNDTKSVENTIPDNIQKEHNRTIISTRTTLVRSNAVNGNMRKRRSSVRSQFKIIKSSVLEKSVGNESKFKSKYKFTKHNLSFTVPKKPNTVISKFKLDNRGDKNSAICAKNKRFVYVNRFLSIADIARTRVLKPNRNKLSLVNISGILYKKSPNCLKRTSDSFKKTDNLKKTQGSAVRKSKYKITRKLSNSNTTVKLISTYNKIVRVRKSSVRKSSSKMRICNVPCPYFRKFGRCKGKEIGKCFRKHDPDQIALCTKFLQGACVDKDCLLSHNVSSEKMPTCKFYLEGSCSKDDCPYLHVRISPKAEICRDFLEGFCKRALECDKRHQFLCPDYEKTGVCWKQRCPYPHGKMVRKYSVFSKNQFAKKFPEDRKIREDNVVERKRKRSKQETVNSTKLVEGNVKSRYFVGGNCLENEEMGNSLEGQELQTRPKLGKLPSFIAF